MTEKVFQLKCEVNNYPWGKNGSQSTAARYYALTQKDGFRIDEEKPYSEVWLGTYPELPAYAIPSGKEFRQVLKDNADELLGSEVQKKLGDDLPYLPKILSIAKALPLQLHPNKSMAEELHKKGKFEFNDPNNKPEIALALTDFEAFCGFKPLSDIETIFQLSPLQQFVPNSKTAQFDDEVLKQIVQTILSAPDDTIASAIDALSKLSRDSLGQLTSHIPALLPRLLEQYDKTDPGILVALATMNYLSLKPGDCIYIPADGIHAYLSGEIYECMVRSNNVLNVGFCPKEERHPVELFCSTLTFSPHSADECILRPKPYERCKKDKTALFQTPLAEFNTLLTDLAKGETETLDALRGPTVLIAVGGDGTLKADGKTFELKEGFVFFVGQGVDIDFESGGSGLKVITTYTE